MSLEANYSLERLKRSIVGLKSNHLFKIMLIKQKHGLEANAKETQVPFN